MSYIEQKEKSRIEAIDLILKYGQIDGAHHKTWVLDQVLRKLSGAKYDLYIEDYKQGENGPNTYRWQTGIAP